MRCCCARCRPRAPSRCCAPLFCFSESEIVRGSFLTIESLLGLSEDDLSTLMTELEMVPELHGGARCRTLRDRIMFARNIARAYLDRFQTERRVGSV